MCNAYNLRHRNEAILDIARAMQLAVADLPEFPPRHRIGIKQRGLILRPSGGWPAGLVLGTLEPGAAGRQRDAALPALQRPRRQARRMAVEGGAAEALPRPRERLLGAREAGPQKGVYHGRMAPHVHIKEGGQIRPNLARKKAGEPSEHTPRQ